MTSDASAAGIPELVLRGGGATVRLRAGEVLLDEGTERRRIPPAAIEEVRAAGRHGRTVEIVLTAARGPARVHALTHHSAEAVAAFTAAVSSLLPPRDADEPREDGGTLVEVLSVPPPAKDGAKPDDGAPDGFWTYAPGVGGALAYLAVLVWLAVTGDGAAVAKWALGAAPLLAAGGLLHGAWGSARDARTLRRRGITVVATFDRRQRHGGREPVYRFTDLDGVPREHLGEGNDVDGDPLRAEITYDPHNPELTTRTWSEPAGLAVFMCVFGLSLLAMGLHLAVGAFVDLPFSL
ncbi:hypothetical protein PV350_26650 [Streptomyces sp. PA03-6a]|nr:hypothetical protein [Streptomyces sp. PA03-6a]